MAVGEVKTLVFADGVTVAAPTSSPVGISFDVVMDVTVVTKTVDVSAQVSDATKTAWTLKKPSGSDYEQMPGVKITTPTTGSVQLDTEIAFDAGTYRLVGVY